MWIISCTQREKFFNFTIRKLPLLLIIYPIFQYPPQACLVTFSFLTTKSKSCLLSWNRRQWRSTGVVVKHLPFHQNLALQVLYFTYLSKNCLQRTEMWLSEDNSPQHPKQSVVLKFLRDGQLHEILRYTKPKEEQTLRHMVKNPNRTSTYVHMF